MKGYCVIDCLGELSEILCEKPLAEVVIYIFFFFQSLPEDILIDF